MLRTTNPGTLTPSMAVGMGDSGGLFLSIMTHFTPRAPGHDFSLHFLHCTLHSFAIWPVLPQQGQAFAAQRSASAAAASAAASTAAA
eukprot:5404226-Prymnesium_polylepis.1